MKKAFKRILVSLLVVVISLTSVPLDGFSLINFSWLNPFSTNATAVGEVYTDGIWEYTVNNGCAIIQRINAKQPEGSTVIIPNKLGGYSVTEINDLGINTAAFASQCNLFNCIVVIPYGVTKLGRSVFNRVKEIAIYLPKSLKEIGYCCFNVYGMGSIGTFYYQGSRDDVNKIADGGSNGLFYNGNIVCNVDYSLFYIHEEEFNRPLYLDDSVTFSVVGKGYKSNEDVPLDGAVVSMYLGGRRIAQKESINGTVTFTQTDLVDYLQTCPFNKVISTATVSAHLPIGNDGFELCSEEVLDNGSWAGASIQNAIKDGLLVDEPRWCVSLKVAVQNYQLDREKLIDDLKQYSVKFANATNGHVIITNFDVVLIPVPKSQKHETTDLNLEGVSTSIFEGIAKSIHADIWINANKLDTGAYGGVIIDENDQKTLLEKINNIDFVTPGYHIDQKGIHVSINDYNLSNTLCHESGHYLFGFMDEYTSGLGFYGYITHPSQSEDFSVCYDYDENGDGQKNNNDEYYSVWSKHVNTDTFSPCTGMVDRPIGAYSNFGLMDNQHVSYEISTREQYRYIDNLNENLTEEEKARSLSCQYYLLGATCEEKLAHELQKKAGMYKTNYSYSNNGISHPYQTAEYSYAGGDNVRITFSNYYYSTSNAINSEIVTENLNSICVTPESDYATFSLHDDSLKIKTQSTINDLKIFTQAMNSLVPQKISDTEFVIPTPDNNEIVFVTYSDDNGETHFFEIKNNYGNENENEKKNIVVCSDNQNDVLTISSCDCYKNGEYESLGSAFWVVSKQGDTLHGNFSSSLSTMLDIDYSSLSWFMLQNNNWVKIDSKTTIDDHYNVNVSCSCYGDGLYVLMATKAQQNECYAPTITNISKNGCLYDDQIELSISDKNESTFQYTVYYSKYPINDVNAETVFSKTILASKTLFIDLDETDSLFYFRVCALEFDGSKSEISNQFSYKIKSKDSNSDGIPDYWFNEYPSLMRIANIAEVDSDDDGLTNLQEYQRGTNPLNPDTDGDNVYDQVEVYHDLNPLKAKTENIMDDYTVVYGTPDVKIDWENLKIDSKKGRAKINLANKTDGYAMRTLVNVYVDGKLFDTYTVNIAKQSTVELAIPLEYFENCSDNVRITVDEQQITRDTDYSNNEFIYSASGMDIVTFDANGGSCSTTKKLVCCRNSYGTLPTPTWKYHVFAGWYTADNKPITDSTTVIDINNHTLYAHWNWEGLYPESGTNIFYDGEKEIIYGFGLQKVVPGELPSMFTNENVSLTDSKNEKIVTGTTVEMKDDNGEVFRTIPCVILGDVNCDGYCDGMDAVKVLCIINGMLTKDDIGTAAFEAADCNRDNKIDQNDFEMLVSSGVLLSKIPQGESVSDGMLGYTWDGNSYVVSGICNPSIGKITVPSSIEGFPVRKIGNNAFASCYAYEIEISNGIQEIGENVFSEYVGRVSLPESVTLIAETAFDQVFKYEYQRDYFRAICNFNSYAAEYCLSHGINTVYNDIDVSSGIEIYVKNNEAFVGTDYSTYSSADAIPSGIFIPEYYGNVPVTKIEEFSVYSEALAISLPSSIKTIEKYAFYSAHNLHCIFFRGTEKEWNSINIGSSNNVLSEVEIIFNATEEDKLTVKNNIEPTCTQYGYIEYECPVCTKTFTVNTTPPTGHNIVDGVCTKCRKEYEDCIESTHDYANSTDESWIISKPGASSIDITFSDLTFVENNYDYIYIYDEIGNEVGKYTGDSLASKTITIQGDTVKIRLKTDGSVTKYGLTVTDIKANY